MESMKRGDQGDLLAVLGKGQVTSSSTCLLPLWLAGRVLQTLVGAQVRIAVGAVMVHILQGGYAEWDEAAANDESQQTQSAAGEPGEGSGTVGQPGHDHLVAGRTVHLDGAVVEGDRPLHINGLHRNCIGVGDRHRLGVV